MSEAKVNRGYISKAVSFALDREVVGLFVFAYALVSAIAEACTYGHSANYGNAIFLMSIAIYLRLPPEESAR